MPSSTRLSQDIPSDAPCMVGSAEQIGQHDHQRPKGRALVLGEIERLAEGALPTKNVRGRTHYAAAVNVGRRVVPAVGQEHRPAVADPPDVVLDAAVRIEFPDGLTAAKTDTISDLASPDLRRDQPMAAAKELLVRNTCW